MEIGNSEIHLFHNVPRPFISLSWNPNALAILTNRTDLKEFPSACPVIVTVKQEDDDLNISS
jgi:hypothetical protein